jgi:LEA14-like dessication related protein
MIHLLKGKRIALLLLALFTLSIAVFLAIDFYHYSEDKSPYRTMFVPRIEIADAETYYLSADRLDMHFKMLIHNPLPFNLAVDSLQYKVFIRDVEIIKSTYSKSIDVPKWDRAWIDLPMVIYDKNLFDVLDKAGKLGEDSIVYRIQTSFYTHAPFKRRFTIDRSKRLPLLHKPSTSIEKVSYDSLNLKGVTLIVKVKIGNRNMFPFKLKDLRYKFALADKPWASGEKLGIINIKERDSTELSLPLHVSFKDIYKSIGQLIRKGGKVKYKFELDLNIVTNNSIVNESTLIERISGTLNELIKFGKEEKEEIKSTKTSN